MSHFPVGPNPKFDSANHGYARVVALVQHECLDQVPVAISDIQQATVTDNLLLHVLNFVCKGWPTKCNDIELKPYFLRRLELTVQDDCLLLQNRVVIPPKFRKYLLRELHSAHVGMTCMKALARIYCWCSCHVI